MSSVSVAVLERIDHSQWKAEGDKSPKAGQVGPYGIQELADHGYLLKISDAYFKLPWRSRAFRSVEGRLEQRPSNLGIASALAKSISVANSDVTLTLFENEGMFAAKMKRFRVPPYRNTILIATICWLSETVLSMPESQRRSVSRALSSADAIVVYSRNQVSVLQEHLKLPRERIHVVDFGVDTDFFRSRDPGGERTKTSSPPLVLAVGHDSNRDYATLFEAVSGADHDVTLVCAPKNLRSLEVPTNVKVLGGVSHAEYRELLWNHQIVVTPTRAPNYPCGQTVILEAMAAGCCTVNTASPALADYVADGIDCLTFPKGGAAELRTAIDRLRTDSDLRDTLASAGTASARERFTHKRMWHSYDRVIRQCMNSSAVTF